MQRFASRDTSTQGGHRSNAVIGPLLEPPPISGEGPRLGSFRVSSRAIRPHPLWGVGAPIPHPGGDGPNHIISSYTRPPPKRGGWRAPATAVPVDCEECREKLSCIKTVQILGQHSRARVRLCPLSGHMNLNNAWRPGAPAPFSGLRTRAAHGFLLRRRILAMASFSGILRLPPALSCGQLHVCTCSYLWSTSGERFKFRIH